MRKPSASSVATVAIPRLVGRAAAGLVAAALAGGCAAPGPRPTSACLGASATALGARAAATLTVRPVAGAVLHDTGGGGGVVPFLPRTPLEETGGEAVIGSPRAALVPSPTAAARAELTARSFVSDDALLALNRLRRGDGGGARRVLDVLAALQRPDGGWGSSFDVQGGYYNAGDVRSGAVAWVVYALARHASSTGDARYLDVATRGADFLLAHRDPSTGLVLAGLGRWDADHRRFDPSHVADEARAEDQVATVFALAALGEAQRGGSYTDAARALGDAIDRTLWLEDDGRYAAGWSPRGLDRASTLDAGAQGALYALAAGHTARARRTLAWLGRRHGVRVNGWRGLRPVADQPPKTWSVAGSLAVALAGLRLGLTDAQAPLDEAARLGCAAGLPLPGAPVAGGDLETSPAAAPTLWLSLVAAERAGGAPFLWSERLRRR